MEQLFLSVTGSGCGSGGDVNNGRDGEGTEDLLTNATKDAFDTSSTHPVLQSSITSPDTSY